MSDREMVATVVGELPRRPSRDNDGRGCTLLEDDSLPDHIQPCTCDEHDGVCAACGFKITVGPDGDEYGHGRANNRAADPDGYRRDCPRRPTSCNPDGAEPQEWSGYEYRATEGGSGGEADA